MSTYTEDTRKVTTRRLSEMKERGEKIAMLTAYDYSMATLIDRAGMDVILVGDSASNVMAGNVTTLPMTLDQMIYHGQSVVRAVKRALVVVDMPFGSYQGNSKEALASAIRIMKETGADAVKLEGGEEIKEVYINMDEFFDGKRGHDTFAGEGFSLELIRRYGIRTSELGCFSIVLEKIPAQLAARVAQEVNVPIIGIGAGGGVDGQVLVMHDMLGINKDFSPRFLRRYANLHGVITDAVSQYISDVKSKDFPNESEQY